MKSAKRCSPKRVGAAAPPDDRRLVVHAVTPSRLKDLEALFGERGACGGCWCTWWRLKPKEYQAGRGPGNRSVLRALVRKGPPPGLLAYAAARGSGRARIKPQAVGWVALAPRIDYPRLAGSRILAPVDDQPVWSVTCFFVARGWRRRGVTGALLEAAAAHAKKAGAKLLEGYPVDSAAKSADTFAFTGLSHAFERAGFQEAARRSRTRPIMRRSL